MSDEATVSARYDTLARLSAATDENERLKSENDLLRSLLRPIAEVFAAKERSSGRDAREDDDEVFDSDSEANPACMPDSATYSSEWTVAYTFGHMRQCCAALGIEVPE